MSKVIIYADGACAGNPGPGGWGVVLVYTPSDEKVDFKKMKIEEGPYVKTLYGKDKDTTNNKMELEGVIQGLQSLSRRCDVVVVTDSAYVKNGITLWISNWIKNGWRTADKKAVKNVDLWQRLYDLASQHDVEWEWVKGHDKCPGNNLADELAVKGRDEAVTEKGLRY